MIRLRKGFLAFIISQKRLRPSEFSINYFYFSASLISGFASSFVSLPFDNAKTKIQKMKKNPDGTFPYKNIFDAMTKTIKN